MNNFSLGGDADDDQEILEPYITQDITKDVISCSIALFRLITPQDLTTGQRTRLERAGR